MKLKQKVQAVKKKLSFGYLHLNSKQLPEVKNFKLGDPMKLIIELDIESLSKPDHWQISEEKMSPTDILARGNITSIKPYAEKKS